MSALSKGVRITMKDVIYEIEGLVPEGYRVSLKKELMISEDIDAEVDKAAYLYGYHAVLGEKAETKYQKCKFAYEAWRANVEAEQSKSRAYEKLKAFTEAQMNAFVMSQDRYRAYRARLLELDEQRRIVKQIAKSFELKKDLVQTKSSNRRIEMKGAK